MGWKIVANELVIEKMYAYVSVDDNKNEDIMCIESEIGPMPLISPDIDRMKMFKIVAEGLVKKTGKQVNLLEFSTRKVLREIK